MNECIFDQIIEGRIPSKKVWESDNILAFWDINSQAPVHVLIIPKKHVENLNFVSEGDKDLLGELMLAVPKVAKALGIDKNGYRLIINNGENAGQLVSHLHIHLIGGKKLGPKVI
jgi:histidine triad (HIT) family protein